MTESYPKSPGADAGAACEGAGGSDWPPAVETVNIDGKSPVVLLCPHASHHIPAEYAALGLPQSERLRHIAWDIGAAGVTRRLSRILDAPAFLGTYSRLLIDLNRPLHSASSIVLRSEATDIPGNLNLTAQERARRQARIFKPHHRAIAAHLTERGRAGRPTTVVAIHSFTPSYHGVARPWHAGVLFVQSSALARATLERLSAQDPALIVGANVPYTVTPQEDHGLLIYGDNAGNPALEFEIRQDLLRRAEEQDRWAQRIAASLGPG